MAIDRKPYVAKIGIKRTPVTLETKYGLATATDYTPRTMQGHRVLRSDLMVGSQMVVIDLDKHPECETQLNASNDQFECDFVARYPGIYELVLAINDAAYRYERFQREMESEDAIFSDFTPTLDPETAAKMYPIAAAYLKIVAWADADPSCKVGYAKRVAAKHAIEQLEAGADVIATHAAMLAEYETAEKISWD